MVVLGAEQEVNHHDGHRGAGDDQQAEAEEEEAEHVVDPVAPETLHDEVEFDEDGPEGQDPDGEHAGREAEVARRGGDLARDLVRADGWVGEGLFEA